MNKCNNVIMKNESTVSCIQAARKAGLDMREVSERLDAAAGDTKRWRKWIHNEIKLRQVPLQGAGL